MQTLTAGSRVGPYEILRQLGAGGMGEVYEAVDSRLGRTVAVKVLPESLVSNPTALKRFRQEARAVAALSHPNIVAIHDFGEQDSVVYVVLEYLEGETLRDFLKKDSDQWRSAVEYLAAAAEAIDEVHAKGFVHRDLKPENLFITSRGVLKVLDFGLAGDFSLGDGGATRTALTHAGTMLGTLGYMSPEQVRGQPATASSDFFSLGCVLYEILTGKRAFARDSSADTVAAILNHQPAFNEATGKWPAELIPIVHRCLAKHPGERFQSGRDLAFAIRNALTAKPGDQPADSIAVLPFANAGGADAEYLSEGIAESLINNLARIPRLRVVPRSVAFRCGRSDIDPYAVGRELGARLLLTGKVMQREQRLLVQAELIDAKERKQVWGERFSRSATDIFVVETEIASQIVEKLHLQLSGEEKRHISDHRTTDAGAYDLYLKARHHWSKRTPESLRRSIEHFEAAIARDARFAQAWAGLADTRILLAWYGAGVPKDLFAGAIDAARTAVRLNEELGEARAALGFALCCTGIWDAGLRECQRGVELNPGYFLAHDWYALALSALARFDEAFMAIAKAKALEPLSLVVHHHEAWVNVMSGRFDAASRAARQALDLDATYSFGWWWRGITETELGHGRDAVDSLRRARDIFGDFALGHSGFGHACGREGHVDMALECLDALNRISPSHLDPYHAALVYCGLNRLKEAMNSLREASAINSTWLRIYGPHDPRLNRLRGDPVLDTLLKACR